MHVCVLGAGIIGLTTAYELTQRGHRVTVIDRATPASGASGGNGAQLSYAYVQPLADPGIWAQLPKLLLSPSSALKIRPQWDPRQWAWVWQFLQACSTQQSQTTTSQLLALAAQSRQVFDAMRERENMHCDFSESGKLVLFRSEASFAAARQQMALQKQLGGAAQRAVSAPEACAIESALVHQQEAFAGAIYTESECAADCKQVCDALAQILNARGAALLMGQAFKGWVTSGDKLTAVRLANGEEVAADAFVLCTGHAAPAMAAAVGVRLPVYPLKGYSITVATDGTGAAPKVSITDSARKIVFARLGQRLRAAGMVELVGHDDRVQARQIQTLQQATQALFPDCSRYTDIQPWAGMRPATPTGLPLIGRQANGPHNLYINAGQGALGFTLASGSAVQLANTLSCPPQDATMNPLKPPSSKLSEADVSSIIAMAWQDDTPFEAIALQFDLTEPEVIALMRASLKARSFRVWRMRVRGRATKHLALQQTRQLPEHHLNSSKTSAALLGQEGSDAPEEFPLPPSPITRQSLR